MNVPNPDGPGKVLSQDPERIGVVVTLAQMALTGKSLYSMVRWLEASDIEPRPKRPPGQGASSERVVPRWHEASVEATLRAPAVAGLTAFGGDVLRGENGLPVVDESVAILTPEQHRQLLVQLDAAKKPGTRQKAGTEPALLYGLIRCGSCDGLLYRATAAKKYRQYRCQHRECTRQVGINRDAAEEHIVQQLLGSRGSSPSITVVEVDRGENAALLSNLEAAIRDTTRDMTRDDADMDALGDRLARLKAARVEARAGVERAPTYKATGETVAQRWRRANGIEERRHLLLDHLDSVRIAPGGGRGRVFDPTRVTLDWRQIDPAEAERRRQIEDKLYWRAWSDRQEATGHERW